MSNLAKSLINVSYSIRMPYQKSHKCSAICYTGEKGADILLHGGREPEWDDYGRAYNSLFLAIREWERLAHGNADPAWIEILAITPVTQQQADEWQESAAKYTASHDDETEDLWLRYLADDDGARIRPALWRISTSLPGAQEAAPHYQGWQQEARRYQQIFRRSTGRTAS